MILLQKNLRIFVRISSYLCVNNFKRYTGLMAAATQLYGLSRRPLALILTHHNAFLRKLDKKDLDNISFELMKFVKEVYLINPKYVQHVMSAMYPGISYSRIDLEKLCPKVNIIDPKSELLVGFDMVITALVANKAIKNNIIFKYGHLSVLGFPDPNKQKKILNSVEYKDTGQPNPDYYYQFDDKTSTWKRFYDLKTGKIDVNKGHIFCVREGTEYEKWSEYILNAQKTCYKKDHPIVKHIDFLLKNRNLSWGERNDALHLFLYENLAQMPGINPSLIIKSKLLYKIDEIQPQKGVLEAVQQAGSACLESYEKTNNLIAESIYKGGNKCVENFSKVPGANIGIKKNTCRDGSK